LKSSIGDILGTASAAASFGGGVHTDGGMEHGSASVDFPLFGDLDSKSFWAAFVNSLLMIIGIYESKQRALDLWRIIMLYTQNKMKHTHNQIKPCNSFLN
jgi:hypothetical protein